MVIFWVAGLMYDSWTLNTRAPLRFEPKQWTFINIVCHFTQSYFPYGVWRRVCSPSIQRYRSVYTVDKQVWRWIDEEVAAATPTTVAFISKTEGLLPSHSHSCVSIVIVDVLTPGRRIAFRIVRCQMRAKDTRVSFQFHRKCWIGKNTCKQTQKAPTTCPKQWSKYGGKLYVIMLNG